MKKALTALIGFGLVLATLALWVSFQVDRELRHFVAELEARPDIRVLGSHIDRGWLGSSSDTRFELRGGVGLAFVRPLEWAGREHVRERVGFRLEQQIEHGPISLWRWLQAGASGSPILAHLRVTLALDQESQAELAAAFGKLPPLKASLAIRASGEAHGRLAMPAAPLRPRDVEAGEAPRWAGRFEGLRGRLAVAERVVSVEVESGGLYLKGAELDFAALGWSARMVGPIEEAASARRGEHTLRTGRLVLGAGTTMTPAALPDSDAGNEGSPTGSDAGTEGSPTSGFELEGLAWKSSEDGESLHLAATADRARWNATGLEELRLDLDWPKDPDAASREEPAPHWSGELGFQPELTIGTFEGHLAEGPFYVSGQLSFDPPVGAPAGAPEILPDDVRATLEIRVPEPWMRRILGEGDDRLTAWLDAGHLGRDRGSLATRLQWTGRTLLANGLPFEALDLVGQLLPEMQTSAEVASREEPAAGGEATPADPSAVTDGAAVAPAPETVAEAPQPSAAAQPPPAAPAP